mgnify:CR=1 FL=1
MRDEKSSLNLRVLDEALYILVRIVPVSWILNVQTIGKSRREEQMKRIEKGTPGYLDYKKK